MRLKANNKSWELGAILVATYHCDSDKLMISCFVRELPPTWKKKHRDKLNINCKLITDPDEMTKPSSFTDKLKHKSLLYCN